MKNFAAQPDFRPPDDPYYIESHRSSSGGPYMRIERSHQRSWSPRAYVPTQRTLPSHDFFSVNKRSRNGKVLPPPTPLFIHANRRLLPFLPSPTAVYCRHRFPKSAVIGSYRRKVFPPNSISLPPRRPGDTCRHLWTPKPPTPLDSTLSAILLPPVPRCVNSPIQ